MCAAIVLFMATALSSPAQTFKSLHSFDNTDGANPEYVSLVQGFEGNLYGTTNAGANGYGTIFKITQSGTFKTVYDFCSLPPCTDGASPWAGLVQFTDGNFYGTASGGGSANYGTVFKITPSGTLTTLYNFCTQPFCPDGAYPESALLLAANGDFYGTTTGGGANPGNGTIFKITPSGTLTTLYKFCANPNCADGSTPYGPLVQGSNGNFYGTTFYGGDNANCPGPGCGTVFKMTPAGKLTTLYTFCSQPNCTDGSYPIAGLVQGSDGNLYGTASGGALATLASSLRSPRRAR